jgi:hypothetical protein
MSASAWLEQSTRWGQVNFNERDPETLDVEWWGRFWDSCDLQGVTLNIGGPMAFYPTDVPLHRRSPCLGQRDLFGEMAAAAKRRGMRVLGRLDPSFTTQTIYDAHPDWCVTRPGGEPATLSSMLLGLDGKLRDALEVGEPEPVYLSCHNSPYYSEFLVDIITEVLTRYEIDGIFTNGWPTLQAVPISAPAACHCKHCVAAWESAQPGRALPARPDPADPVWRSYLSFVLDRVEEVQRQFRDLTIGLRPNATFLSVTFPTPATNLRWDRWIDLVDALGSDAQGRRTLGTEGEQPAAIWEVGQQSELLRSVARGKPMIRFVATYMAGPPFLRHAARPPLETRMIMVDALAHGERPKWHTLGGVSHDRRWMADVRELDRWMAANDRYLHNVEAVSDVAIVWSPRSVHLDSWRTHPGPSHREAIAGWYAALMEARAPFEYVHEDRLDTIDRYRTLVLPTGLRLDDVGVAALDRFRRSGGSVVACCGALAADEWDEARDPGDLSSILGVRYTGQSIGPLLHSYIGTDEPGELLQGLGDTDILGGGRWIVPFTETDGARVEGSWIEDYPTNPTHLVVLPEPRRDVPIFNVHRSGESTAVHIAADLDAAYARHGFPDHGLLLRNALEIASGGRTPSVEVIGEGLIDTRAWRQNDSITVFIVNIDNPMLHGGPVRSLRPVGPIDVAVRLDRSVSSVRLLRDDVSCDWHVREDGSLVAAVPSVRDFEVIAIDLVAGG